MAHEFEALGGDVDFSGSPQLVRFDGTNAPSSGYAFDAATEEQLFFRFRASDYTTGDVTVTLDWYADTATSGDVMWGAQLTAITPNSDTQDVETFAFPTVTTVTDTHLGTTGQRLHRATVTLTGAALDSLAVDDHCVLRISRQAGNAADTMTGDAVLLLVQVTA